MIVNHKPSLKQLSFIVIDLMVFPVRFSQDIHRMSLARIFPGRFSQGCIYTFLTTPKTGLSDFKYSQSENWIYIIYQTLNITSPKTCYQTLT